MIRHQYHLNQLRVDTQIKIIEEDGTETTASVVVLVGLNKVDDKQQYNIYRIVNNAFNKDFTLDRRIKASAPKKPWWKLW
jgi:GTP:adenosylcobinamide-phosphate guanylyltransferase